VHDKARLFAPRNFIGPRGATTLAESRLNLQWTHCWMAVALRGARSWLFAALTLPLATHSGACARCVCGLHVGANAAVSRCFVWTFVDGHGQCAGWGAGGIDAIESCHCVWAMDCFVLISAEPGDCTWLLRWQCSLATSAVGPQDHPAKQGDCTWLLRCCSQHRQRWDRRIAEQGDCTWLLRWQCSCKQQDGSVPCCG